MRATRLRLLPVTLPKLTKLERLDLGANSFIDFVSHRALEIAVTLELDFFLAQCFNEFTFADGIVARFE